MVQRQVMESIYFIASKGRFIVQALNKIWIFTFASAPSILAVNFKTITWAYIQLPELFRDQKIILAKWMSSPQYTCSNLL